MLRSSSFLDFCWFQEPWFKYYSGGAFAQHPSLRHSQVGLLQGSAVEVFRAQNWELRVEDLEFRVQVLGFWV